MIRHPCSCICRGTECADLPGSRDAPTTAIVVEPSRISFGVRTGRGTERARCAIPAEVLILSNPEDERATSTCTNDEVGDIAMDESDAVSPDDLLQGGAHGRDQARLVVSTAGAALIRKRRRRRANRSDERGLQYRFRR